MNCSLRTLVAVCALLACSDGDVPGPVGQGESAAEVAGVEATPADLEVDDEAPTEETAAEDEIPPPLFPRGLVTQEPGVSAGYVFFNPLLSDTTYLVNNGGSVVHRWKSEYSPGGGIYMLPSGNLLRTGRDPERLLFRSGGTGGILQEIDWEGNVVWEWRFSDDTRVQHHDIQPLPNGNLLVLAWEVKSSEEAQRAGRRADQTPEQGLWPDWLLEVEPIRPNDAKIVWEWHSWDHLIQNADPEAENYGDPAEHPRRIDINAGSDAPEISADEFAQLQALGYVPEDATSDDLESDFLHTNAISYHPKLDQIALSVPVLGEIWIIDHATTTEEARGPRGDLLYRWGNPSAYGGSDAGGKRFFYQHDVRWIPDGLEGAGNLTVFNNGDGRAEVSFSSIDEWTPPLTAGGGYTLGETGLFGPSELAWQFVAETPSEFFSPFISGAQRLANGNTMICSGVGGRFIEVTRAGDIVWEYRNPFSGSVRNSDGSLPQPGLDDVPYAVFRATRIPADQPGLANRKLGALDPQPAWFDFAARESDESKQL
ncbi:MAG: aryl-sulfate sulfotransferase [Myxococcales bacterium]|nr:aryl-sulfate sulfotransferase [Myxococcales bacterium]